MSTRCYRPGEFAHVADAAEVLRGRATHIATEQLIPRIGERSRTAIETVPTEMYFYQALRSGRRCSCFDIEVGPTNLCSACFGSGIVGGYSRYGTDLVVVDVTYPNLRTSNVIPDRTTRTRPTRFALVSGATHGSVEARIEIGTNVGILDALTSTYYVSEGNSLTSWVKGPADRTWIELTRESLTTRLVNSWLDLKVTFDRATKTTRSPMLDMIYLRYRTLLDDLIRVEIPRAEKSSLLQDVGLVDEQPIQNFWLDGTLKSVTTDDFFVSKSGVTRWKIQNVKDFAPNGYVTSWDLMARIIQSHEPFYKIPAVLPPTAP